MKEMDVVLREYLTKELSRIDTGMSENASLRAEGQVGVKPGLLGGQVWDREKEHSRQERSAVGQGVVGGTMSCSSHCQRPTWLEVCTTAGITCFSSSRQ